MSWIITCLALGARYSAAKLWKSSWILSGVNQILYLILVLGEGNEAFFGLIPLSCINLVACVYGYIQWERRGL